MKTKHKLLSKAAAVFVTICMLFTLTPLNAFAFSADNYKAQIEKVSVGAPITSVDGGQYLPVTVYFSAAEDLGDSNAVYFLEGYLKATLGDGTTTEGIAGLGMTLMGPLKPDALAAVGSNAFSWEWSEGKGTGVLKYNIPLLNDGETQSAEKSPATGQVEVNGLKADDKVAFQIETVMNSSNFPPEVLPEGGSLMSDEFVIPIEDSSNYPKTITQSSGEEKCKHDGELKYEYVSDNQHNVICQKCGTVIETEGHTTSDEHKFFDKEYHWWVCKYCNAEFYKGSHHLNQNYDENTHWSECADPLCNYKTTPEKHDFTFHKNDDGTSECICGAICQHDGELKYEYVSDNQHNVICQKCGTVIETEGHTTSDEHKFFDKEYHWWVCKYCNAEFYKGSHHLNQNYDENTHWSECADPLCNYKTTPEKHDFTFHKNDDGTSECICGAIQAAPALPDLSKTTVEGVKEDKTYTKEEAEKLELSVDGKKLDKESYTVKVEDDENGKLIVTFEPIEGKSTGKKQVIVDAACKHDGELTYYAANAEQHTIFCEKCQKEIGVEDHDFTRHMTGYFDSNGMYAGDSQTSDNSGKLPVYGEADVCVCGASSNFKEIAKYSFIEGSGQIWNKLLKIKIATVRVNCDYGMFTGNVEVDGKQLTRDKDFTDKSGSTIITLTSDYLQTLTAGKHTIKVYFEDGYAETEFTVEDTSSHVADDEELEKWAAKDYQDKTGTSANAKITAKGDDQYEITLTDDSGKVLDTYTINPDTGVGTDTAGNEVNLPQTGISDNRWVWIPLAALMCMMGIYLVRKSRKEDEES